MKTLFVSDLDGTLLNEESALSSETIEAIHRVYEKGDSFVIATGRHQKDIENIARIIGRPIGMIGCNGATVVTADGISLGEHSIEPALVKEILSITLPDSIYINLYTADNWYTLRHNDKLSAYSVEGQFSYSVVSLEFLQEQKVIKFFLWGESSPTIHSELEVVKDIIEAKVGSRVDSFFSHTSCLEVMPPKVNKGSAVALLCDAIGFKQNQIIAFGDGENDIEMLNFANTALVMGNSPESVQKKLPQATLIGNAHENGVAQWINSYYSTTS